MGLLVEREQLGGVNVRIALCGAEPRVPQEFLDGAQVGTALQEMCGEGVAQRVWADPQSS